MEFVFEKSPVDTLLEGLSGDTLSGAQLLTALEGEDLEQVLEELEQRNVLPLVEDLPRYASDPETDRRLHREEKMIRQGDLLASLEEGDPLRLYLEELASIPVCGDVELLALELERIPPEQREMAPQCQQLTNLSLSRVVELAGEYTGRGVLLLDLIQEGSMGLWQGLASYGGEDFAPQRDRWIRFAMAKAVLLQAQAAGVGQRMRENMEDFRSVEERLLGELGRSPELSEIAQALHMTQEQAAAVGDMVANAWNMSRIKAPAQVSELPEEEDQSVENTAYFQIRSRIEELLERLEEQDRQLLSLRYGLSGGVPLSAEQTGARLGLTAREVNQREAAALALLRTEQR